jgi:hypothetical protein
LQVFQVSAFINDSNNYIPIVTLGFGLCCGSDTLGVIQGYYVFVFILYFSS